MLCRASLFVLLVVSAAVAEQDVSNSRSDSCDSSVLLQVAAPQSASDEAAEMPLANNGKAPDHSQTLKMFEAKARNNGFCKHEQRRCKMGNAKACLRYRRICRSSRQFCKPGNVWRTQLFKNKDLQEEVFPGGLVNGNGVMMQPRVERMRWQRRQKRKRWGRWNMGLLEESSSDRLNSSELTHEYETDSSNLGNKQKPIQRFGFTSIACDPTNGYYYNVEQKATKTTDGRESWLNKVNPWVNAVQIPVARMGKDITVITFGPGGSLYAIHRSQTPGGGPEGQLFKIGKGSGKRRKVAAVAERGETPECVAYDGDALAFNPKDGLLYHWTESVMEKVDGKQKAVVSSMSFRPFDNEKEKGWIPVAAAYAGLNRFWVTYVKCDKNQVAEVLMLISADGETKEEKGERNTEFKKVRRGYVPVGPVKDKMGRMTRMNRFRFR